jgi:hypothetical protein
MDRHAHHCGSDTDPPYHRTKHVGIRPSTVLPREDYGGVEKGNERYKVASIEYGTVHLSFHVIIRNIIRKNCPRHVTRFVVDLAGKCLEGMQMNSVSYLINRLEKNYHEA